MTDLEFDVMDELYFVITYDELQENVELQENDLNPVLLGMIKKGWVKCFKIDSEEVLSQELDFAKEYREYRYLATKAGLLSHNSRD